MAKISWVNGYVRNDDAAIYYEVHQSTRKDAPVLILLHGNSEDMHIFDGHFDRLLPYYTVLTVDTRGQGKSARGTRPLSYELFAQDLFTLANKLQIGKFLVLGFSDGANTALEFALTHQGRIAAMILVGGNLSPDGISNNVRRGLQVQAAAIGFTGIVAKARRFDRELMGLMLAHPHIDPKQLAGIKTPTLVISGGHDTIKDEHSRLIASSLGNARHAVIEDAGHFVMKDAPEEFDRIVYDFLMEDD
ncbi:MAG: alpha/beta hydrolase [Coriobacteriales bacterium]|nr:alpha/beta hydrolase [Coriobacteriales bacterium]